MNEYRAVAKAWVQDARTNTHPPTWGEHFFERGGGASPAQDFVLQDTLVPHSDGMERHEDPTLLVLKLPTNQGNGMAPFVEQLMHREVKHLLVLGEIHTPGLRGNLSAQGLAVPVEVPELRATLRQSPARPTNDGWTATLDIQPVGESAAAHMADLTQGRQLAVFHLKPRRPGLLDPDELRTVSAWLRQVGGGKGVAVTGGDHSPEQLPAMLGQLLSSMAFARRHPDRAPCGIRRGRVQDEPMREGLRELHQRNPHYIASWQHLASVAAVRQEAVPERMRWPDADTHSAPRAQAPGAPDIHGSQDKINEAQLTPSLPWRGNPNALMLGWDNAGFVDDAVPQASMPSPSDSPPVPRARARPAPAPRVSVIRKLIASEPARERPVAAPRAPKPPQRLGPALSLFPGDFSDISL